MITIQSGECVRYYSKLSECTKCQEACPTEAIKCKEGGVELWMESCVECGACMGVCPTEAISLSNFNVTEFFFDFVQSDEKAIGCKYNFLCLAALGSEYLISLGLAKEGVVLDIGHCEECELKERCFPLIEEQVSEANYVLEAIGGHPIEAKKLALTKEETSDRREFFNLFSLKGAAKAKGEFEKRLEALDGGYTPQADTARIRQKNIPNKRKLLFTLLKRAPKPQEYKLLENEYLSFTSDKLIDESCDNCSICYRICPTEALSTTRRSDAILFDPLLCVRCHLCHDVCEKESIQLAEYFDTKELFEPEQKVLAKFKVIRCDDCGNLFTYFGGERICPRCQIEEQEARDLWGIE